jgi:hypothetical protein
MLGAASTGLRYAYFHVPVIDQVNLITLNIGIVGGDLHTAHQTK